MDQTVTRVPTVSARPAPSIRSVASAPTTARTGSSWDWETIIKVFLILVVLTLLGLNVFTYLAKGTDYFSQLLGSVTRVLPQGLRYTVTLSEKGTELGLEVAAGTVQDVGDVLGRELDLPRDRLWKGREDGLQRAVDQRKVQAVNKYPEYEPDTTESRVQSRPKEGWCYIGTDRGFRSCISVKDSDKCMSGKIFPSKRICISPSLRP